jgi:linoleoyl-CoA desaturase
VCHSYYGEINPLIAQATQAHGLVYHNKSLGAMMRSHFAHLAKMGRPE